MADDFTDFEGEGSVGFTDVEESFEQAPSFEEAVPMEPATISGGLDHLRARRMRQIDKLRKSASVKPVWNIGGEYVDEAPDPVEYGQFVPIGGRPVTYKGGASEEEFLPIQERQARTLQAMLPPVKDSDIWKGREKLFGVLLNKSGGKLDFDTFFDNPHWDEVRSQGVDDESLEAMKMTAWKAIRPMMIQYAKFQNFDHEMKGAAKDPLMGMLLSPKMEDLKRNWGKDQAYHILSNAKGKARILQNDPDLMNAFEELKSSPNQRDQDKLVQLLTAPTPYAFTNQLNGWIAGKEKRIKDRIQLHSLVDDKFRGLEGEWASTFWKSFSQAVEEGKFDGKTGALSQALGQAFEKSTDGGQTINPIWMASAQAKMLTKIHEKMDLEGAIPQNLYITPEQKIITTESSTGTDEVEQYRQRQIKSVFGNTDIASPKRGDWVKVPASTFVYQGNIVYPKMPIPMRAEFNGRKDFVESAAIRDGNDMYIPVEWMKRLGIEADQIYDTESKTFVPHEVSENQAHWFKGDVEDFRPTLLSVSDFLESKPDEQTGVRPMRADGTISWIGAIKDQLNQTKGQAEEVADSSSMASEVVKGFFRPFRNLAVRTAFMVPATAAEFWNTLRGVSADVAGNQSQANEFYNKALGEQGSLSYANLDEQMQQAYEGGWIGSGLERNKNASNAQIVASSVSEGVGGLLAFLGEIQLGGAGALTKLATGGLPKIARAGFSAKNVEEISKTTQSLNQFFAKMMPGAAKLERLSKTGKDADEFLKLYKRHTIAQRVIHDAILFPIIAAQHGEANAVKLLEEAAKGGAFGIVASIGKGFSLPLMGGKARGVGVQPKEGGGFSMIPTLEKGKGFTKGSLGKGSSYFFMPDGTRVTATGLAGLGIYGYDYIKKSLDGKTDSEIMAEWTDPEFGTHMATNVLWMMMGRNGYHLIDKSVSTPKEQPRSSKEAAILEVPDAANAGSTREISDRIRTLEEGIKTGAKEVEQVDLGLTPQEQESKELVALRSIIVDAMDRDEKSNIKTPTSEDKKTIQRKNSEAQSEAKSVLKEILDGKIKTIEELRGKVKDPEKRGTILSYVDVVGNQFAIKPHAFTDLALSDSIKDFDSAQKDYERRLSDLKPEVRKYLLNEIAERRIVDAPTLIESIEKIPGNGNLEYLDLTEFKGMIKGGYGNNRIGLSSRGFLELDPSLAEEVMTKKERELHEKVSKEAAEFEQSQLQDQAEEGEAVEPTAIDRMAQKASERISARRKEGRVMTGIDPADFADHVLVGVGYVNRGIRDFTEWSKKMISELGESVKPHLEKIWKEVQTKIGSMKKVQESDRVEISEKQLDKLPEHNAEKKKFDDSAKQVVDIMDEAGFTPADRTVAPAFIWRFMDRMRKSLRSGKYGYGMDIPEFTKSIPSLDIVREWRKGVTSSLGKEGFSTVEDMAKEFDSISKEIRSDMNLARRIKAGEDRLRESLEKGKLNEVEETAKYLSEEGASLMNLITSRLEEKFPREFSAMNKWANAYFGNRERSFMKEQRFPKDAPYGYFDTVESHGNKFKGIVVFKGGSTDPDTGEKMTRKEFIGDTKEQAKQRATKWMDEYNKQFLGKTTSLERLQEEKNVQFGEQDMAKEPEESGIESPDPVGGKTGAAEPVTDRQRASRFSNEYFKVQTKGERIDNLKVLKTVLDSEISPDLVLEPSKIENAKKMLKPLFKSLMERYQMKPEEAAQIISETIENQWRIVAKDSQALSQKAMDITDVKELEKTVDEAFGKSEQTELLGDQVETLKRQVEINKESKVETETMEKIKKNVNEQEMGGCDLKVSPWLASSDPNFFKKIKQMDLNL